MVVRKSQSVSILSGTRATSSSVQRILVQALERVLCDGFVGSLLRWNLLTHARLSELGFGSLSRGWRKSQDCKHERVTHARRSQKRQTSDADDMEPGVFTPPKLEHTLSKGMFLLPSDARHLKDRYVTRCEEARPSTRTPLRRGANCGA